MNRNKKGQATPQVAKKPKNGNAAKRPMTSPQTQKSAAAAYATGQSSGKARFSQNSVDSCRIVHRELVGSVVGTVAFAVGTSFSVNPGLAASFPWLSTQAEGWEKYRFNSLKLCYYTRTGSNVPGSVILTPDYDAADAAPSSEQVASASYGAQEDAPWKDICLTFDRNRLAADLYVRTGALAANLDVKTYDVADAFVCTIDGTAVPWGKLWFEYDITLMNPQLPPGGALGSATIQGSGGSIAAATPFGAVPLVTGSYALSGAATSLLSLSGLVIGQEYEVAAQITGTVISSIALTAVSGLTLKFVLFAGFPAAATTAAAISTFTATASSASLTFAILATTVTASTLMVTALVPAPAF